MIAIQYPSPQFRLKKEKDKQYIFDALRKVWLLLTEEEWVRQNFVNYLIAEIKYPSAVIALEKEIELNGLKKRFDVLVYDKTYKPWMLVECKAPEIKLSEDVLQQVLRYNMSVPVEFIVLTNGSVTVAWKKEKGGLQLIENLPEWGGEVV